MVAAPSPITASTNYNIGYCYSQALSPNLLRTSLNLWFVCRVSKHHVGIIKLRMKDNYCEILNEAAVALLLSIIFFQVVVIRVWRGY